ncbi:hypothetical protein EDB85DRAFT_2006081 [Lactarius pseudohatsudake]|nr:hypothetical protein EDB85DRAFT_2006081 [Lactarius pseudohatsudake]
MLVRSRQTLTTLALLQAFYTQTRFLLSRIATVLPSTAPTLPSAKLAPRDLLGGAICLVGSWVPLLAGRAQRRLSIKHGRIVLFESTGMGWKGRMTAGTQAAVVSRLWIYIPCLSLCLSISRPVRSPCRRLLYLRE